LNVNTILDFAAKILGVSGLAYGVGLVSINISYFLWGFHDFDISYQQGIFAGLWTFAFVALAYFPAAWGTKLLSKLDRRNFKRKWLFGFVVFSISLLIGLLYWHRTKIHAFLSFHVLGVLFGTMAVLAAGIGWSFWAFALQAKMTLFSKSEDPDLETIMTQIIGPVFWGLCLIFVFAGFYACIPAAFGGGKPERHDLWVSADALAVLGDCAERLDIKSVKGHELTLIGSVWILHEAKDNVAVWRDKCPIVALPRTWIRSYQWPQQNRD
jgi:hypothetical protein